VVIDKQIAADGDDARNGSAYTFTVTYLGKNESASFRFTGITIPQGSLITAAYLTLTPSISAAGVSINILFYGEKASAPVTGNHSVASLPRTVASVPFSTADTWWAGTPVNSPSIVPIVQELVDAYDYSDGAMRFFNLDNGSASAKQVRDYHGDPAGAARLHIEYEPPTPPSDKTQPTRAPFWGRF
jgi:hypothetical protein